MKCSNIPRRESRKQRGVVLLLTTLFLLCVALPMMGLAIDTGVAFAARARLQTAVDGAALAGARSLSRGRSLGDQRASAESTARAFFNANMYEAWSPIQNVNLGFSWPAAPPKTAVLQITANALAPTYFLKMFGYDGLRLEAIGTASRRDVNIILVLDRSGSIENMGACDDLRSAAKSFVATFVDGRDRLGLVTFGTTYRVDFPAAFDFKSAATSIVTRIDAVRCVGGTNSASAYWVAWQQLQALNEANTLNVILFFTDGQPNGLHMNDLRIAANCVDNTARNGVIVPAGTTVWGIFDPVEPNPAPARNPDWVPIANRAGCHFAGDYGDVDEDVISLTPAGAANEIDNFGNALTGYKPTIRRDANNRIRINDWETVTNAATNALDNAASRVRSLSAANGLDVHTYVISLAGAPTPAEATLMKRVANTNDSPIYDSTRATGMFVLANNAGQLEQAFSQLASDILRISR